MRQLFICAVLLFGSAVFAANVQIYPQQNDKEPYIFEDLINSTIEGIRPDIPDPLIIDDLTITIPEDIDILRGSAELSNLQLTGLQGFQIPALSLSLAGFQLNFTLVLPTINLNTNYKADLTLLDLVPLYGDGQANIHLVDVEIEGSANANLTGGISIANLRVQLYLGSSTFDIHGALDNEEFSAILSQILNDVVTTFVDNHQEVISNIISPILEGIVNAILAGTPTTTPAPVE